MLNSLDSILIPSFAPANASDPIDYGKIAKVFTGKHTATMYDRQEAVLLKLAKIYKSGLVRKDLPQLAHILQLTAEKIDAGADVLIPPLENLLSLVCIPFQKYHVGEQQITPVDHISEFAMALARIMKLKHVSTVELAGKDLLILVGGRSIHEPTTSSELKPIFINPMKMKLKEAGVIKEAERLAQQERDLYFLQIEKSNTVEMLLEALKLQHDCPRAQLAIVKSLRKMSTSHQSIKKMWTEDALSVLVHTICRTKEEVLFTQLMQIVWNLLSVRDKARAVAGRLSNVFIAIANQTRTSILTILMDMVCHKTMHYATKAMRNEYAVILNAIAELCDDMPRGCFESGFVDTVGRYMMSHELGGLLDLERVTRLSGPKERLSSITHREKFLFTSQADDFEFKTVLMQLAQQLCTHEGNLTYFLKDNLLEFLLLYLEKDTANAGVKVWTPQQLEALQQEALAFLNSIVPRIPQAWASIDGNATVLEYLKNTLNLGGKSGDDTKTGPEPGLVNNPKTALVGSTLRLLSRISELGPSQKRALGNQGIFSVLIAILTDRNQKPDIWRSVFLICSSLCQGCKSNKTLFGEANGVETILPFLTYSSADPQETEAVILAAIECIWGSICGHGQNEATFFAMDGIFALLDLLVKSSYASQRHILGSLLDLLENPKARSHVLQWRSAEDEQKGVAHSLIKLWNLEEARLGVPSGLLGQLVDEKKPLHGKNQIHKEHSKDGFVIEEITENLRAKIYSMFCKLGFDGFEEAISVEEQVKLALIAKYLDFKIGEVWEEISDELDYEGIRPISPDLDCIDTAKQVMVEKAQAIQQKQSDLIQKKKEIERVEEDAFYLQYIKQRGIHQRDITASQ